MPDDFTKETKRVVAARVASKCSNPACRASTTGPRMDPSKSVSVGVAAHITAASPGGPRYDVSLTEEERRAVSNAIWLCQTCAKQVDNDVVRFTVGALQSWKKEAEREAIRNVGKTSVPWKPENSLLTEAEEQLLKSAPRDGVIFVMEADQLGKGVCSGRDFLDQTDPAFAATYCDALEQLMRRGLVRHDGGSLYRMTRVAQGSGSRNSAVF